VDWKTREVPEQAYPSGMVRGLVVLSAKGNTKRIMCLTIVTELLRHEVVTVPECDFGRLQRKNRVTQSAVEARTRVRDASAI
jgi:hypothetical protein